ncbi:oxidoreductase [Alkalihalophilus pseudofirmus]|nr:oxidoreductase [Alkalihalophilus pseudofirmus]
MTHLKEKVVVITGASSGIGQSVAQEITKLGGTVVLSARREERLKEICNGINANNGKATYFCADVSSSTDVQSLANYTIETHGKIDVWINNAGLMPLSFLNKLKVDEWDRMIDVNIKGVLYGIAAAVPIMEKQNSGHIINVSSVAGHRVGMAGAVYSGTKFAVRAITEGLRMELSPTANIRTTIISPGAVATELFDTITDQDAATSLKERIPKDPLEAKNIADAIIYAITQPKNVSINEILIRPTEQPS